MKNYNIIKIFFKSLFFSTILVGALFGPNFVFDKNLAVAEELSEIQEQNQINFFYSTTCPHCIEEENFLNALEIKYPEIKINRYEFSKNIDLAKTFYSDYNVPSQEQGFIPITFIKDRYFIGFDKKIGEDIEKYIQSSFENEGSYNANQTKIPFFGQINTENFSLPLLAVIFGFFDGFNICSLGSLVLILGIVISLKSRKQVLILGGSFVLVTAIIYWFLIFLWHQLFVFLTPYIRNLEIIIGLLAVVGAWYLFREFLKSRKTGAVCQFGGISEKLAEKVNNALENKTGVLAMIGIVFLFASAITIIEFPCSALFPVLFAGTLSQSGVSFLMSATYMGIFIFFYMLDELVVLFVAVFTMKIWIASPKIMTWLNLTASAVLFVFGFYYLLWPTIRVWFNL